MSNTAKTVFITGATSGIGEAAARRFAREGVKLVLCGRRFERLEKLASELKSTEAHIFELDVRDQKAVESAIGSLPSAFASVDILVNNAGLSRGLGMLHEQPMEDLQEMVDTNIKGMIHVSHAVMPGMVARNRGHIINIGSIAGTYPYPGGAVYGGTKAFVEQFSLGLRAELLGRQVRVTNIEPGLCETEFSLVRFHGDKSKADAPYKGVQPLTPADIAEAIFWCSSQPAHVNVNRMEIMPVMQASGPLAVHRD